MPPESSIPEARQIAVYRKYLQLQSIAESHFARSLAGRLILSAGFGLQGAQLALATVIAGGTFLGIESDANHLKAAVRNGSCDFMVTTLDEALRVLKNEIRKGTPLSTGLLGSAAEILPAIVERGVQPDLIAAHASRENPAESVALEPAINQLVERGAQFFRRGGEKFAAGEGESADLAPGDVLWTAANPQDLRRMDQTALDTIPPEDWVRRRWLQHAAGYFHRQAPLERVLSVREEERTKLLSALRQTGSAAAFQPPTTFRWLDPDRGLQTTAL
ncbi:MAG TPA: hypothetical protein VN670_05745 [Acidobacteriaceae bacterium]|nr:hypothetical protein [Acidobacteriaceae bacterium]